MLLLILKQQVNQPVSFTYFILLSCILTIVILSFMRTLREGIYYLKMIHAVPCNNCKYFTGNYCLKCTIHPKKALTEQAIFCPDYQPEIQIMSTYSITCQRICSAKKSFHYRL